MSPRVAVEPARCAVIEDTPSGVTAAVSAGMRAFGYAADSDPTALRLPTRLITELVVKTG